MDESKKYWRDKVAQLLGWGLAALVTISAWSLNESELFELGPLAGNTHDLGNVIRAVVLLLFAVTFPFVWFGVIRWIYTTRLSEGIDDTVLPWKFVKSFVVLVSFLMLMVSALVALR